VQVSQGTLLHFPQEPHRFRFSLTNGDNPKLDWAIAFVALNGITAGRYYFQV
jgi:hypothetical protein